MGYYLNPKTCTKETWLSQNGEHTSTPTWPVKEGYLPVCLVDNGMFTAAGVAFSSNELDAFTLPTDYRHKTWYLVKVDKLLEEIPDLSYQLRI